MSIDSVNLSVYTSNDIKRRNSIIIKSGKKALLIDPAHDESFIEKAKAAIGDCEVLGLYSHSHINHLSGMSFFKCADIISHYLLPNNKAFLESNLPHPTITYRDSLPIKLGDLEMELMNLPGHLDDMTVVLIPALNTLFASDLILENSLPFLGDGDIFQYINSISKLCKLNFECIIPGHGNMSYGFGLVNRVSFYLNRLMEFSENCLTFEELKNINISSFQNESYSFIIPEFHEVNLKKAWESRIAINKIWD